MNFNIDSSLPAHTLTLDNTADVVLRAAELQAVSSLALQFPKWTDGRAYSQARLLRSRLNYRGRLVAVGDVVVDMLPLLQRCGFDAAVLREGQDARAARRALGYFEGHSAHYQADLITKLPLFAREVRA